MSKTHIDIDDDLLAQVAAITGTTTKRDTVEAALRTTLRQERRRAAAERLITRGESGYFAPLLQEHPEATGEDTEAPGTDGRTQGAA
ncbi:type II toxin-antitoxin system VapB family antitoxin [Kineococcus rhizosphaerae]|uniref:VapB protein of antitoxin of type II toxin-antitoxin system n=1 Tax=Kineococcus rhizosphaerae TaxID=559628 RepID=A0A2T0R7C7_9ACTN|nr:type II toxin-antitoxin system VapB family antitoxin [Kineococcus rhizosphaerae]PRY17066.1 VapB protein of antitoxin of type II toxin-antitoxin system [Kineococcus rhizosphaerae]